MGAMQAHIAEHLGFAYRVQIEKQLGMNLPPQTDDEGDNANIDPEVEAILAPMIAQAAQRLLAQNQQEAQQQQAQQQAQDPIVQMQQQELQLKQAELQRKTAKDQLDAQIKGQQLGLEKERIDNQAQIESMRIASKVAENQEERNAQQMEFGIKAGLEAEKNKQQMAEKIAAHVSKIQQG
jgi:hypothetical protein